jgi:hypothetical protein
LFFNTPRLRAAKLSCVRKEKIASPTLSPAGKNVVLSAGFASAMALTCRFNLLAWFLPFMQRQVLSGQLQYLALGHREGAHLNVTVNLESPVLSIPQVVMWTSFSSWNVGDRFVLIENKICTGSVERNRLAAKLEGGLLSGDFVFVTTTETMARAKPLVRFQHYVNKALPLWKVEAESIVEKLPKNILEHEAKAKINPLPANTVRIFRAQFFSFGEISGEAFSGLLRQRGTLPRLMVFADDGAEQIAISPQISHALVSQFIPAFLLPDQFSLATPARPSSPTSPPHF